MPTLQNRFELESFKEALKAQLIERLEADLKLLMHVAVEAREAAIHEESKAEDKYDTRGLEASYLAGAQAKRASELGDLIAVYKRMPLQTFSKTTGIAPTALIELESAGKKMLAFMVPKGGGIILELDGKKVQVLTPNSKLGEELVGRKAGDAFEVEISGQIKSFQVLSVK